MCTVGYQYLSWRLLTSFAGSAEVSGTGAVAHVSVPALPAGAAVQAGVAQALFGLLLGAGRLDPHGPLRLCDAPDVFTLAVHEQVPHAAHVAVVQQSRPHLRGEDQTTPVLRQTTQIQNIVQVQNLTLSRSIVGCAHRVDRDGT